MDPNVAVSLALTVVDEAIALIKWIKGQAAMTTDEIIAAADAQDLKNKDDIKTLLALWSTPPIPPIEEVKGSQSYSPNGLA